MKHTLKTYISGIIALGILAVAAPVAQAGTSLNDETIYAIFDQANMADISTGRLGWKKAHAKEVRNLAKMVVSDHSAVQQMGRDMAIELGYVGTPPDNDTSVSQLAVDLAKLEALDGSAFDRAYLRHEVDFHSGVIAAIKGTLLPAIKNPKFKTLLQKVLPGFEHHLAETKKLAKKFNVR